ncbi:MAG: glycosyltransferase family 4 protein [Bacteroidales bacterium]|nr:glycosyltransferase family 4 protein [Bacteroidales bacterium]
MDSPKGKTTVVVSAVNIRKGGTLTILRSCLRYLSENEAQNHRIVALVHDRSLCDYPGIEYIEFPDTIKSWGRRLWCEYVTMHKVSKQIAAEDGRKVWMWLSLHDTTPRVIAEHRQVYCHTSFPFMKIKMRDFLMDPKIPLFAMFTRFAYRINVHKNDHLIVQQEWFRKGLSRLVGYPQAKIRVIPPETGSTDITPAAVSYNVPMFFYASTADCHKNFETLCRAAQLLESKVGKDKFKLVLTISGRENRYSRWLYKKWGSVSSIDFHGFMSKEELYGHYKAATAFVFPSRVETWGLPITEFMATGSGKLLLADLPYAHESSKGARDADFFPASDYMTLADKLYESLTVR